MISLQLLHSSHDTIATSSVIIMLPYFPSNGNTVNSKPRIPGIFGSTFIIGSVT